MKREPTPFVRFLDASEGSVYKLTVLAAKRALQLADGDASLIDKPSDKVLDAALQEIGQGKIRVKPKV
ncbi:MAG: DNA-directed RNA polymerase subunit omega [Candidatus Omnitrophica bacterium]|jgi:DNA-directed RNA polymerase omega subunit|nr:DNA-directed RNA polymerase subunit omega [Candidatus Omnitrophota bacterium]MDD5081368.1 DNA-directed RNA polymerase subunit omega [Candidatus Omnitrophota bacterium]